MFLSPRSSFAIGIVAFSFFGCSPSSNNNSNSSVTVSIPTPSKADTAKIDELAKEVISQLRSQKLPSAMLTVDFRKVIGEPLTPTERELGYSDSASLDVLKIIAGRLPSDQIKLILVTNDVAIYELDQGTLRLIKADGPWKVDWIHAGRPKAAAAMTGDDAMKRFALATFLDPLFTNNFDLAEGAMTAAAKSSIAPPFGRDQGYNRGTLRGKLRELGIGASGYQTLWDGATATVTMTGQNQRKFSVTVGPGTRMNVWQVTAIELP